jgi:hypothetical protein
MTNKTIYTAQQLAEHAVETDPSNRRFAHNTKGTAVACWNGKLNRWQTVAGKGIDGNWYDQRMELLVDGKPVEYGEWMESRTIKTAAGDIVIELLERSSANGIRITYPTPVGTIRQYEISSTANTAVIKSIVDDMAEFSKQPRGIVQSALDTFLELPRILQTFTTTTQESSVNGDWSDAGWIDDQGRAFTGEEYADDFDDMETAQAHEAYKHLYDAGAAQISNDTTFSTVDPERDYQTGEETVYDFHLENFTDKQLDYIAARVTEWIEA